MSLTINAGQLLLAQRPGVTMLPLVVVETYSDRDARTVASTYYWTRGTPLIYQWDGSTDSTFVPVLENISPISRGFGGHLPDQGDYSTREVVTLTLDGTEGPGGYYLFDALLAEQLIGARVTIGSLLVDLAEAHSDSRYFDQTALGRVHVTRWRGEVTSAPEYSQDGQTFDLTVESEELRLQATRTMVGVPTADPLDDGKPYSVPLGTQTVEALYYDVSASGLLGASVAASAGTAKVYIAHADLPAEWYLLNLADQPFVMQMLIGSDLCSIEQKSNSSDAGGEFVNITFSSGGGPASAWPAGTKCSFPNYRQRYAVSGAGVAGIASQPTVTIDGVTFIPEAEPGNGFETWIENIPNGDAGGTVGVLTVLANATDGEKFLEGADRARSRVDVEVNGPFTVAASSSTFLATGTGEAANWGAFARSADPNQQDNFGTAFSNAVTSGWATITDSGSDLVLTVLSGGRRLTRFDRSFSPSASAPVELRFNLNIPVLTNLRRVVIGVNITTGGYPREAVVYEASELSVGDNNVVLQSFATAIVSFSIVAVWDDTTANRVLNIRGNINAYTITPTDPLGSHPLDVLEQVLDDFLPTAAVTANASTFSTAKTNTPNLKVTPDLSRYITLGEFLAAVGFNARTNFALSETYTGTEVKAYAAETDYDFPLSIRAIGEEYADLRLTLRSLSEIANRFVAVYDLTTGAEGDRFASYAKSVTASEIVNELSTKVPTADITASQADFGIRDAVEVPFQMIDDDTAAIDVLGYYATESLRGQVERYRCQVPVWIGYDLEAGDIVSILPKRKTANVKVRITQTVFNFNEGAIGLSLEAVT